jgi:hypothetical protein
MKSWWLDVKLGVRMLIKYPGLALAGGFGIAVAVAIAAGGFSVLYGNFLAPALPLEEGGRLVSLENWDLAARKPERRMLHEYHVWRGELRSVPEIGAFRTLNANLTAPGVQQGSVRVAAMSAAGFTVARVRPLMGRHLEVADEREGAPTASSTYRSWQGAACNRRMLPEEERSWSTCRWRNRSSAAMPSAGAFGM